MKLSLACNWDPALVEGVANTDVTSLYAGLPAGIVGGGRSSLTTVAPTPDQVAATVAGCRSAGLGLSVLLNSACRTDDGAHSAHRDALIEHLGWLCELGVESVTVALPWLIRLVRQEFPGLAIKASSYARIDTVARAQAFAELGVDTLCLPENVNRDFRLLEALRAQVDCELMLIANLGCLYACPHQLAHQVALSHASQGDHFTCGYFVDTNYLTCTRDKLRSPVELIKARWIRPEDVHHYEDVGIDTLKVLDRVKPTEALLRYARIYTERRFDGNLLDLLNLPDRKELRRYDMAYFRGQEHARTRALIRVLRGVDFTASELIQLDASKLPEDFLETFRRVDCRRVSCGDCGYCDRVAEEVLSIDAAGAQARIDALDGHLGTLARGELF